YNIQVELTATERVGFHQYHFPADKEAHVCIDLKQGIGDVATDTYIEQVDDSTLYGYRFSKGWAPDQRLYFAIRLSAPIQQFEVYDSTAKETGKTAQGKAVKALLGFGNTTPLLLLKVGIS